MDFAGSQALTGVRRSAPLDSAAGKCPGRKYLIPDNPVDGVDIELDGRWIPGTLNLATTPVPTPGTPARIEFAHRYDPAHEDRRLLRKSLGGRGTGIDAQTRVTRLRVSQEPDPDQQDDRRYLDEHGTESGDLGKHWGCRCCLSEGYLALCLLSEANCQPKRHRSWKFPRFSAPKRPLCHSTQRQHELGRIGRCQGSTSTL